VDIEWNEDGLQEMAANIERALDDIMVPSEGSEEDAIADVKRQLIEKGVQPNDEGVAEIVRKVRQG
jgi:hypothetical protein